MRKIFPMSFSKGFIRESLLVGGILFAALILYLLFPGGEGSFAEISVAGKVLKTLPLSQEARGEILDAQGEFLLAYAIEEGAIQVVRTTCPDELCRLSGAVSEEGRSIICLPNQVVIRILPEGKGPDGYDGVLQ